MPRSSTGPIGAATWCGRGFRAQPRPKRTRGPIEADVDPVEIGAIAADLSLGGIAAAASPQLIGYAASGDSIRGGLEVLGNAIPLSISNDGEVLRLGTPGGAALAIDADALGAHFKTGQGNSERLRRAAGSVPDEVGIIYYDPARDWQASLQRASTGGPHANAKQVACPPRSMLRPPRQWRR